MTEIGWASGAGAGQALVKDRRRRRGCCARMFSRLWASTGRGNLGGASGTRSLTPCAGMVCGWCPRAGLISRNRSREACLPVSCAACSRTRGSTIAAPASDAQIGCRRRCGADPVFKRVLLKISGEALMGPLDYGTDPERVEQIAARSTRSPAGGGDRGGRRRRQHLSRARGRGEGHGPRDRRLHGHAGDGPQRAHAPGRAREASGPTRGCCRRSRSPRSPSPTSAAERCATSRRGGW